MINITIDSNNYPILNNIKLEDLDKFCIDIFNVGYNTLYPKPICLDDTKIDYLNIINKIDTIKPDITDKLSLLNQSLEKLVGLSNSSVKKGMLAENILENIFTERYGDIEYTNMSHIPHSGDAWLKLPNNKIIMLESKNYNTVIDKHEINKMQNDMIVNNIHWGIFISFNSKIQGMKEFDFYIFQHQTVNFHIIMLSNLNIDITRLDMAFNILRKLILLYSDLDKSPWITYNIKNDLDQLNELIEFNYILRDNFTNMEKDIIRNINSFYHILRDYQFNLDKKVKDIINKITNNTLLLYQNNNFDYTDFITNVTNKDKKLVDIAHKLSDLFKKKNIKENNYTLNINDIIIANVKVNLKKIIIEFTNYDISLYFIHGKDKEINQNLLIFENLIL